MLQDHIASAARIPVVKMVGGSHYKPKSRRYEVVAHAIVDERDAEYLSGFTWTLAKDLKTNYANRNVWTGEKTVKIQMHNQLWERHNGPIPSGYTIDHIDRDGLNNRIENFRLADRAQQRANQGLFKNSKTGFKGVCWNKNLGRYQAGIQLGGKRNCHLGLYDIAEEGAHAWNVAARMLYGDFAWTNDIPAGSIADARMSEIEIDVMDRVSRKLTQPE